MNLTNCPICGQPAFDLHLTPQGYCVNCDGTLRKGSAIRDVAGLWNRAMLIEDEVAAAYNVIARSVPNVEKALMVSVAESALSHATTLRDRGEEIMREHGITLDDMDSHYNSEAEKAVAHYDPTPMLPAITRAL
jgi:hypothetical protein